MLPYISRCSSLPTTVTIQVFLILWTTELHNLWYWWYQLLTDHSLTIYYVACILWIMRLHVYVIENLGSLSTNLVLLLLISLVSKLPVFVGYLIFTRFFSKLNRSQPIIYEAPISTLRENNCLADVLHTHVAFSARYMIIWLFTTSHFMAFIYSTLWFSYVLDCVLNHLFREIKKTSKLHVTGLCEGNSVVAGGFFAQRTSNAQNVSIWWRHHEVNFGRIKFPLH